MNSYKQGRDTAMSGGKDTDNPHKEGTWDYDSWLDGFYYEEVMEKTHKGRREWQ